MPRRKLSLLDALTVTHDAATGISYMHSQGLAHKDIKAGNLLVFPQLVAGPGSTMQERVHVKVADLGLSRKLKQRPTAADMCANMRLQSPSHSAWDENWTFNYLHSAPRHACSNMGASRTRLGLLWRVGSCRRLTLLLCCTCCCRCTPLAHPPAHALRQAQLRQPG